MGLTVHPEPGEREASQVREVRLRIEQAVHHLPASRTRLSKRIRQELEQVLVQIEPWLVRLEQEAGQR